MKIFSRLFGKTQFKVRVNYKSGISEEFWCYGFTFRSGEVTWTPVDDNKKPIFIGIEPIESVYQVGLIVPLFSRD